MPFDVLITTAAYSSEPTAREFIQHLQTQATALGLDDGAVYYRFPSYADYETVTHRPDALLISRSHGVLAIMFVNGADMAPLNSDLIAPVEESLVQFTSTLIGRLLRSGHLRKSLSELKFPVTPVIFLTGSISPSLTEPQTCRVARSLGSFDQLLSSLNAGPIASDVVAEIRSVVEGAKALARPKKRNIANSSTQRHAAALAKLEAEIANFDQRQRRAALQMVRGPQRIRGLAGSGKTIILAVKAAHLHLENPSERILITFYTRSLRTLFKNLITRFYRHYKEEDPDWERIHIRHAWGGATAGSGTYADACRRAGIPPLTFRAAQQGNPADPFDYACKTLLGRINVEPFYDHVLIDEGQDFPSSFYELCFKSTNGERDRKSIVWAYDELQNILDVNIRNPEELFGLDADGSPRVSLERSVANLPPGATNDTVLSKCYRNQREVLVTAHAVGFGIYREIVQMLESKEHWQDVGYEVEPVSDFSVGQKVKILRPPENSPLSLSQDQTTQIIERFVAQSVAEEIQWVVSGIQSFIQGGLQPEDILVIAMDDRHARIYLQSVSASLAHLGLESNNITADPYNEPPFILPGKVTLSTVYRAKGNEASVAFAMGVDAIMTRTRSGRNKLFTAFTRTKAWLRVSGLGANASKIAEEVDLALKHFPYLEFKMPDLKTINLIQRDLSKREVRLKKLRDNYIASLRKEGLREDEIQDLLASEGKDA